MTYAKVCGECYMWAGQHAAWCSTRGYSYPATKHAPVKPPPAPVQGDCPCGRARAGCEYHDPALQPVEAAPTQRTYEVEDTYDPYFGEEPPHQVYARRYRYD